MKVSIVIPCYNEEKNIPLILSKFQTVIEAEELEVILVDNGSTDGTSKLLNEILYKYPFATSIRIAKNQGYGYGILKGLNAARGDFIGWTHADMQTDPEDIIKAYYILKKKNWDKNIYVKGNRKGRPLFDTFFTLGMSIFETLYLKQHLEDVNAQPNLFSKDFYQSWINPPHDFSLDLYALYMAQKGGLEVVRFPVLFPPRIHGKSHWNTGLVAKWKFIKRTLLFSKELKKSLKEGFH